MPPYEVGESPTPGAFLVGAEAIDRTAATALRRPDLHARPNDAEDEGLEKSADSPPFAPFVGVPPGLTDEERVADREVV